MALNITLKDTVGAKALLNKAPVSKDPVYRDTSKEVSGSSTRSPKSTAEQEVLKYGGTVNGQSSSSSGASSTPKTPKSTSNTQTDRSTGVAPTPVQPTTTGTKQPGVLNTDMAKEKWDTMSRLQQNIWMKLNPTFDVGKQGWELSKSNAPKQEPVQEGKNDAWIGNKGIEETQAPVEQPQAPDYQSNSPERMTEIANNLELAYQQTPDIFKNRSAFDEEFAYTERSKSQQTLLDQFFRNKQKEAVLKTVSAQDIVNSIASGSTSIEAYAVLEGIDPIKYKAVLDGIEAANKKKQMDSNLAVNDATMGGTKLTLPPEFEAMNKQIEDAMTNLSESYEDAVNDPDLLAKKDELTELTNDITQMDSDIMRVTNEVKEQYPGVPRSQLNAIVADRTDKYRIERGDALIKANTLQGLINNRLDEAQIAYKMQVDKVNMLTQLNNTKIQQLGFAFEVFQYQDAPNRAKELAQFNAQLSLETGQKQMEQEYAFNNPQWDSTDPAEQDRALNMSLDKFYADFGTIINRGKPQVIADIKAYAKEKGISLSQAMQENFVTQLKGKPEYQMIMNTKLGISNEAEKTKPLARVKIGEKYNQKTGQYEDIMGSFDSETGIVTSYRGGEGGIPVDAMNPLLLQAKGQFGGECGVYANDATGVGSEPGGDDSIAGRLKTYTDTVPVIGGMAFFSNTNNTSGHVAVVTNIDASAGMMTLKDSNYNGDGKIDVRTVPIQSAAGFYNNTPLAQKTQQINEEANNLPDAETTYNPELDTLYASVANGKRLTQAEIDELAKNGKSMTQFYSELETYKKIKGDPLGAQFATEILDIIGRVKDGIGRTGAARLLGATSYIPGTQEYDFRHNYDTLISKLSLDNLVQLKANGATFGSLSNQELNFITAASTSLGKGLSDDAWNAEINEITLGANKILSATKESNAY